MKAILFNNQGFRKEIVVDKDSNVIVMFKPFEIKHVDDLSDDEFLDDYKIYYHRERSFLNEDEEIVIMYRQER